MKTKIVALLLFVATIGVVAFYPSAQNAGDQPTVNNGTPNLFHQTAGRPKVDLVFVLDTTGSMGGMIQAAKEKIWSIVSSMALAQPTPEIRMGLVAYRDRGDAYVTRVYDLSSDLDSLYAELMDFRAEGGGDGPESVNKALYDGVHKISWSQDTQAYRVLFLVGDAPPHMDYQDDVNYRATVAGALEKGISINTIQCGRDPDTERQWQQIAWLAKGRYFQVEQSGSAVAIATPFDERLAELSKALDGTRLLYGNADEKKRQKRKLDAAEKMHTGASAATRARRATFNVSKAGESNFLGDQDLVEEVASGRVELDHLDAESLPAPMQSLSSAERKVLVTETKKRRSELQAQIKELARERTGFIERELESRGGAKGSLDDKIYTAVREQAGERGLKYEAAVPAY